MVPIVKKWIAVVSALALSVSAFGGQASALQYTGTGSYMSGKYYRQLRQVRLTGNPRTDIVAVARSQVGYQEGDSENELSGEIYGGDNFTEYGHWYDMQDMWCAMFVSWCADTAGISTDVIPSHSYTPDGLRWFAERGLAFTRADVQSRKYTPKPGDLVYFKSSRNANPTNHVGVVTGYSNNRLYTIEGNIGTPGELTNGGMVAEKSYPITNTYIVYICAPDYESGSTNVLPDGAERTKALQQESLRNAVFAVETGDRLGYGAVHVSANGAVTLGCGQWYGAQAAQLLQRIYEQDASLFGTLDVPGLLAKGKLMLNEQEQTMVSAAISSDVGIQAQNDLMDQNLQTWLNRAEALGITDRESLLLFAALCHLCGIVRAEQIFAEAADAPNKEAMLNTIKNLEPGLYRTCCLLVE